MGPFRWKFLRDWWTNWSPSEDVRHALESALLEQSNAKLRPVSVLFILSFSMYGILTYEFLKSFDDTITVWNATWPRLAFNALPFAVIVALLSKSRIGYLTKGVLWIIAFSLTYHAAAWIDVWPLILKGHQEVLTSAHFANGVAASVIFIGIAPPAKLQALFMSIFFVVFWVPFFMVAKQILGPVELQMLIGDVVTSCILNLFLGASVVKSRSQTILSEMRRHEKIKSFTDPHTASAIIQETFEAQSEGFAFIVQQDMRGSTRIMNYLHKVDQSKVDSFQEEYGNLVRRLAKEFGGYIKSEAGDGHMIIFEEEASTIPTTLLGHEDEANLAELNIRRQILENICTYFMNLTTELYLLGMRFELPLHANLGAAVVSGRVKFSLSGADSDVKAFSIGPELPTRAARLEQYAKKLYLDHGSQDSVLILAPETFSYLRHGHPFVLHDTKGGVREHSDIVEVMYQKIGVEDCLGTSAATVDKKAI